jgi:hypothetical protein
MRTNTKRLLASATVLAAASVIGITSTAVSIASPAASTSMTLRLLVHGGSFTIVNVANRKAFPSTGDELILVQPVYAAGQPRKVIGHAYITATFVTKTIAPPAGIRDEVTLVLKAGDIELAGVSSGEKFTAAVTGGTGIYQGARGQASITTGSGQGNPASVKVTLLR